MTRYEYKVVPAPEKGQRVKGAKGPRERFAHVLETLMNELGAEGWDYLRADTLPCEERTGLTGKTVVYQNMLVFRRALGAARDLRDGEVAGLLAAPKATEPTPPIAASAAPAAPFVDPRAGYEDDSDGDTAGHEPRSDNRSAAAAAVAALRANRGVDDSSRAPKLGPAKTEGKSGDGKPGGLAAE
ncbi:DUF4177 domain-containing protein [Pacificitalea manganoxidans]|uniref:DUF4177 domain-containing protein n=1 Tax=Pacificitalea manganoxidans TaxID=1411902 RepID=UPI0018E09FA0|nr:hypothetical protein [Pacificitalea manganoxidans]